MTQATLEKKSAKSSKSQDFYIEGVGRRKTAVARVRIYPNSKEKSLLINEKELQDYFPLLEQRQKVLAPLEKLSLEGKFKVSVKVKGGGLQAQAEAIRLGLSRALVKYKEEFKPILRQLGFLTRDPRMVERKKPGLKKARRAPQWQKR